MEPIEESSAAVVAAVAEDAGKNSHISAPAESEPAVVAEPEAASVKKKSGSASKGAPKNDAAAVTVSIAALKYSAARRNSMSVAQLQTRLADCNYGGVRADFRGWYHDSTRKAVSDWQKDNGLEVTGACTADDMAYLFDGTDIVLVA